MSDPVLESISAWIPVAHIPELIITLLAGDDCLDNCLDETFEAIFRKHEKTISMDRSVEECTYLDSEHTILHSFSEEPAIISTELSGYEKRYWYKNGKLHSFSDTPAVDES